MSKCRELIERFEQLNEQEKRDIKFLVGVDNTFYVFIGLSMTPNIKEYLDSIGSKVPNVYSAGSGSGIKKFEYMLNDLISNADKAAKINPSYAKDVAAKAYKAEPKKALSMIIRNKDGEDLKKKEDLDEAFKVDRSKLKKGVGLVKNIMLTAGKRNDFKFVTNIERPNVVVPSSIHSFLIDGLLKQANKDNKTMLKADRPVVYVFEMDVDDDRNDLGLKSSKAIKDIMSSLINLGIMVDKDKKESLDEDRGDKQKMAELVKMIKANKKLERVYDMFDVKGFEDLFNNLGLTITELADLCRIHNKHFRMS
jgi:hypothetical protein